MKVLVMIKGDGADEDKVAPTDEMFAEMNVYNEQLVNAGIMLAGEGLKPSSNGAKVVWDTSGEVSVVDGPFTEAKEIIAGYWIWQVSSLDEAVEWAKRCPSTPGHALGAGDPAVLRDGGLRPGGLAGDPREGAGAGATGLKAAARLMADARRTVEVIWRIESPRLIASLTRLVRDVGLAEELAQDAFVTALEQWPVTGVPDKPGAWLMVTARHRAIDLIRREQNRDAKYAVLARGARRRGGRRTGSSTSPSATTCSSLVFLTCHPVLPRESRIALTLRLFGGLTTEEIARAYLVPSPTIGQRISRAKRTLAEAHVPFEVPQADEMPARVGSVLEVLYVIFTEGHAATSGADVGPSGPRRRGDAAGPGARRAPAARAGGARAGRADGAAGVPVRRPRRRRAAARTRTAGSGTSALIEHGLAALDRATTLGRPLGPYTVQAAIAACHSRAPDVRGHRLGGDRRPSTTRSRS